MNPPTVFVVDSDSCTRQRIEQLARSAGWHVETAACAEEFLAAPRLLAESCLVVEQCLPGSSGLDLQRCVAHRTEMPLVFMTSRPDVRTSVQAMKAGATEFLVKPFTDKAMLVAIAAALEHSRNVLRHSARVRPLQQRYQLLSPREREVMSLIVSGHLNKQVGGELGISEITVKAHRGRAMKKMQAGSLAELVIMAATLGREGSAIAQRA
jgi:FixJ family two-component response regulator